MTKTFLSKLKLHNYILNKGELSYIQKFLVDLFMPDINRILSVNMVVAKSVNIRTNEKCPKSHCSPVSNTKFNLINSIKLKKSVFFIYASKHFFKIHHYKTVIDLSHRKWQNSLNFRNRIITQIALLSLETGNTNLKS